MKLRGRTYRQLEGELYAHYQNVRELQELKEYILFRSRHGSNPTQEKAIGLVASRRLNYLREITRAVHKVYHHANEEQRRFMHLKYFSYRQHSMIEIARRMGVKRKTVERWRRQIVTELAKEMGWR